MVSYSFPLVSYCFPMVSSQETVLIPDRLAQRSHAQMPQLLTLTALVGFIAVTAKLGRLRQGPRIPITAECTVQRADVEDVLGMCRLLFEQTRDDC